jgi:hypothetical protein
MTNKFKKFGKLPLDKLPKSWYNDHVIKRKENLTNQKG